MHRNFNPSIVRDCEKLCEAYNELAYLSTPKNVRNNKINLSGSKLSLIKDLENAPVPTVSLKPGAAVTYVKEFHRYV
jgi:hypothetical protein